LLIHQQVVSFLSFFLPFSESRPAAF